MTPEAALDVLTRHRGQRVVITTMASIKIWHQLSDTPLDFPYLPSSMGQAPALGLGLALACPGRGVIVVNGDGSTLMNLGALVTIAGNPADLFLIIMDNGIYEVTGGQPVAGPGRIDYAGLARAAGIKRAYHFTNATDWQAGAAAALTPPGPVVVWLEVEGKQGQPSPLPVQPMAEQIARLRQALGV